MAATALMNATAKIAAMGNRILVLELSLIFSLMWGIGLFFFIFLFIDVISKVIKAAVKKVPLLLVVNPMRRIELIIPYRKHKALWSKYGCHLKDSENTFSFLFAKCLIVFSELDTAINPKVLIAMQELVRIYGDLTPKILKDILENKEIDKKEFTEDNLKRAFIQIHSVSNVPVESVKKYLFKYLTRSSYHTSIEASIEDEAEHRAKGAWKQYMIVGMVAIFGILMAVGLFYKMTSSTGRDNDFAACVKARAICEANIGTKDLMAKKAMKITPVKKTVSSVSPVGVGS